ncbi:MAG: hypothetical protein A2Y48_09865 [Nitrospirae bacterium RIFCSPLOW2_12_42_9]|nr:MAG: hypothetical protein A2Y48_09865 [Nitrospirae bacterium RIFCSPLOW2_12_42_9]
MFSMPEEFSITNGMGEMTNFSAPFKLLSMANEFERAGVILYAVELYTKILDNYPDTFEAVASRLALFLIASRYENDGKKESAIAIIRRISTIK